MEKILFPLVGAELLWATDGALEGIWGHSELERISYWAISLPLSPSLWGTDGALEGKLDHPLAEKVGEGKGKN
jgi:hypothetical protein